MVKSERAAKVMAGDGGWVNDSEASFLAMHFGAAVHRMEENAGKRLPLIGVICPNGIGASYILAASLKKYLSSEARFAIGGWENKDELKQCDLLVSTVPLTDAAVPVIVVSNFPGDADLQNIRQWMSGLPRSLKQAAEAETGAAFALRCSRLESLCADIRLLLEDFKVVAVDEGCDMDALMKRAGYLFGEDDKRGRLIYDRLKEREKLSTQVIPKLQLVLLHGRTEGVKRPVFVLLAPTGERFSHPLLRGARSCALLLMPANSGQERTELMGSVSAALIEDEAFLEAVQKHDGGETLGRLRIILEKHIKGYLNKTWRG
jgi:mannitol operon transcriptional antiterminator